MERNEFFRRDIEVNMLKWMERKEAYAIKGPRQSGKTTLLRILEDVLRKKDVDAVFLNFEDPDVLDAFDTNPKEYVKSFMVKEGKYCFLMDEYHYVKDPGKKLKLLYDTFENVKFIVTGSSSLELGGAMARFLVGRVFFFELFPFSFHEFLVARDPRLARIYEEKNKGIREFLQSGKAEVSGRRDVFVKEFAPFLEQHIVFGGYPAVIIAEDFETKRAILKGIYDTYISKDVVGFLKVSDALRYRHVVRALAVLVGNLINYNEICSVCQTYYKELRRIMSILSETYVVDLVRPFYRNPVTELKKVPKVYFFDLGLRNYVIDNFGNLEGRVDRGALIENFVFLSLKNNFPEATINYWRTIAKAEVDFVLRIKDEIIPVEVKYQSFRAPKISRGLRSFVKSYNTERALVITRDFWGETQINDATILFAPTCYL